jgi:hypothetical protein
MFLGCTVYRNAPQKHFTEEDFIYVYKNQYWTEKRFIDSFGRKPNKELLLRNNPNFKLWDK